MTGADKPGHSMFIFPTPMTCPRFKSRILIRPAPLPRPFFAPALLTDVTDFHSFSAGTLKQEKFELEIIKETTINKLLKPY